MVLAVLEVLSRYPSAVTTLLSCGFSSGGLYSIYVPIQPYAQRKASLCDCQHSTSLLIVKAPDQLKLDLSPQEISDIGGYAISVWRGGAQS